MAESNQNITSFSDSVANIIKNIQDVGNAQVSLVKAIATTSGKVVAADVSIIEKNIKSVNVVNSSISNYLKNISAFIKDISDTISNENSNTDIKSIFGYMERVDEIKNDNGEVDKKVTSKFLLIDGLSAMMSIFSSMTKIIEGMANSKFESSSLLLGVKIKIFTNNIKTLLSMVVSSLKDINNISSNIDIDQLMGSENTVDKNNIERQLLNGQLQSEKTSSEKTTSKKYGIIEVIEKFFGLGNLINQIEVPNILSFNIKLEFFDLTIKQVISKISKISKQYSSEEFKKDTDNFSKITENLAAGVSNIQDLMDYIMMSAMKFKFSKKSVMKFFDSIWSKDNKGNLSGVLPKLFYIMKDRMIGDIGSEKTSQLVEKASQVFQQFTQSIAGVLMVFGDIKMILRARFANKTLSIISIFLSNLCDVITKISKKFEKLNVKTFKETLSQISDIVDSLKNIATKICVIGLLALPAMVFMIPVIIFALMLIPFLFIVSKIVVIISKINNKSVSNASKDIAQVLGLLVVAALSIIAVQYLMTLIIWDNIFKNLLLLFAVILVASGIVALLALISKISGPGVRTTTINVLLVLGLLVATALMLIVIQAILEYINWEEITIGLLKIGAVVLSIIVLAGLLGAFSVVYMAVMIGLVMMVSAILSIVLIAVLLITLQNLNGKIDEEALVGSKKSGDSKPGGVIGTVMSVMEEIGNIAWNTDFLNPLTLIWITIKFAIMAVTIGLILLTGWLLLKVQTVLEDIDQEKIKSNIKVIFNCVQEILDLVNTRKGDKGKDGSKRGIITEVISTFSPGIANLIEAILSFAFVITALLTVGMILLIGKLLLKVQTMFEDSKGKNIFDKKKIKSNIKSIFDCVQEILDLINTHTPDKSKDESKRSIISKIISMISPGMANLIEAVLSFAFVLTATLTVGVINYMGQLLSQIADFKWKDPMSNIENIINTAKSISNKILAPPPSPPADPNRNMVQKAIDSVINWAKNTPVGKAICAAAEVIKNMGAAGVLASTIPNLMILLTVVETLEKISNIQVPSNTLSKVEQITNIAKSIARSIADNGTGIAGANFNNFGNFTNDSIKYFDGINKLDVSKVKSIGDMYEKMGQFMEKLQDVPINDIADTLINKISPALSDINTSLNNKPTQTTQTAPINSTNNTSDTQTNQNTPVGLNNKPQQIGQVDYTGILENIETLLEQIKHKLNIN